MYYKYKGNVIASPMSAVRSLIWVQILRKLTKSVIGNCHGDKWFRGTHSANLNQGSYRERELYRPYSLRSKIPTLRAYCILSLNAML